MENSVEQLISEHSNLLWRSDEVFWRSVRELLRQKDVDPFTCLLSETFEDGIDTEFGVLVTSEGKVFQFVAIPRADGDGFEFSEWNDLSLNFRATPYRTAAEVALRMQGKIGGDR